MATDERLSDGELAKAVFAMCYTGAPFDVDVARRALALVVYDGDQTPDEIAKAALAEVERLRADNAALARDLQRETDFFIEAGKRHEKAENWLTIERASSAKLRRELAEAQRENEALREVAQAVVAEGATMAYNDLRPNPNYCVLCDGDETHTSDCPFTRFRALLEPTEQDVGGRHDRDC